ncbi:hypothetical protein SAMN06297468_0490 [Altererythrobacter xiamenensis]|uniref:Uncharacterized protein n=1 Tax=Altererythrobacter xiamenensis TaxID=1316679 RepID=A0A1Y6EK71_9SPHN|nr:glycoside hydrolase [Altererythrobacter xiamenensis]SMQ60962.1 hypothetical protein SAMN06297468_0490 [Altererythrobacter xiamenensis]
MELTFIGLIQIAIGTLIVLVGSVRSAVIFLVVSALFDGSAAIALPELGGSSIPPVQFALLFTTLRIIAPRGGYLGYLPAAIAENKWIVFFAIYGVVAAYLAPRMFGTSIEVFPMRPELGMGPFDTIPLVPSPQNLTAAFYLIGTLLLAISSYIFCRMPQGGAALVAALLIASWLHIATGVIDLATRGTAAEVILSIFRNGGYTPLDLSISGFIRIRGVLPETSSYAGLGFALFVANAELWYRSIRSRTTGLAASALALLLVLSTASTAYVALAAYVLFLVFRAMLFPGAAPRGKLLRATYLAAAIGFLIALLMALVPRLPFAVYELVLDMTVAKPATDSGQQRLFWALQGWDTFLASYGLGIGPGSFRSSSMLTAILGSMGVVGAVTFVMYCKKVFAASRQSTWGEAASPLLSVSGALGTAALICLVPAAIASPHAVPPALFSIMAGAAIALRSEMVLPTRNEAMPRRPFRWPPERPSEEVPAE